MPIHRCTRTVSLKSLTFLILITLALVASLCEWKRMSLIPMIRVSEPTVQLGYVHAGEIHYRTFDVENFGNCDVTIDWVSCPNPGTIEMRGPVIVKPGTQVGIQVGLLIRDKDRNSRPDVYSYVLKSDDPAAKLITLRLVASRLSASDDV
jgi:hypothetical protein